MLIRFRVKNFRSLKEEQELSMVASTLKDKQESVTQVAGLNVGLLRVAAIYGANASGKTNVIKALEYMSTVVRDSQRNWPPEGPVPRNPFLLDEQSKRSVSSFEADVLVDGTRFSYGFALNDQEVVTEHLYAYPAGRGTNRRQTWFRREGRVFTFGKNLTGDNAAIERLTRSNSLFLSAAAQNNHEALLPLYKWFAEKFTHVPRDRGHAHIQTLRMCQYPDMKKMLVGLLQEADLGIIGLNVREVDVFPMPPEMDEEDRAIAEEVRTTLHKLMERRGEDSSAGPVSWEKRPALFLIHRSSSAAGVPLREEDESAGTLAFFGLLGPVLKAFTFGGTLCVDELDASLHPLLVLHLVEVFNDPKVNDNKAQIIFTTHDTNVLSRASLRRDQIWFTEKDPQGGTHLYPLTDFTPRKNENLGRGYLQGRYGAVPFVGSTDLFPGADNERAAG